MNSNNISQRYSGDLKTAMRPKVRVLRNTPQLLFSGPVLGMFGSRASQWIPGGTETTPSGISATYRMRSMVASARKGEWSEADLYDANVAVSSTPQGVVTALPWYISIPGGFIALLGCSRLLGAFLRSRRNNALEERGFKRNEAADQEHYNRMMKGLKTVRYDDLTEEQMLAARRRRQREVSRDSLDIDTLELPENHPFAVKKDISKEEEELQRQRLMARRGLSAQDMELLRKQQQLADEMDRQ